MAWAELKPGFGGRVDLRAAVEVVAHRELRPGRVLYVRHRGQRHHVPVVVAHIELAEVLRLGPGFALGLHVDLPLPAEAVEVVDEVAAHEGLERLVNVLQGHALLEHLVPVHIHEDLGHGRRERGPHAGQLGPLPRRLDELLHVVHEKAQVLARAVLQDERHASGGADAGNGRRRKGNSRGARGSSPALRSGAP